MVSKIYRLFNRYYSIPHFNVVSSWGVDVYSKNYDLPRFSSINNINSINCIIYVDNVANGVYIIKVVDIAEKE